MAESDQQVDHTERSREWLRRAEYKAYAGADLQYAQVHASLAIADQLERLNENCTEIGRQINYLTGDNRA